MGQWLHGKRHGQGQQFLRKGDRYKGEWRADCRDGFGELITSNGSKFVGNFKKEKKHGKGEMHRNDQQVVEEHWQFGILVSTSKKVKKTTEVLLDAMTQGNAPLSVALADKNILHPSASESAISLRTSAEQRIQINQKVALLI